MAIFSLHIGTVGRSGGGKKRADGRSRRLKSPRSCQVAAAYKRAGTVTTPDKTWDYTKKKGVFHFPVYVPEGTPAITSEELWIKADAAEKRKDATTAREGHAALPYECSPQEHACIIHEFSQWMAETHQVAFDVSFHNEGNNPHIDFQFTTRVYEKDGSLGKKTRQFDELKTGKGLIESIRAQWAAVSNKYLLQHGVSIDHRSYARQGMD